MPSNKSQLQFYNPKKSSNIEKCYKDFFTEQGIAHTKNKSLSGVMTMNAQVTLLSNLIDVGYKMDLETIKCVQTRMFQVEVNN